jgi:small-conductance mechanosensitive channel
MRSLPLLRDLPEPYASALAIALVVVAGWLGTRLLLALGQRLAARAGWGALETALARVRHPASLLVPALVLLLALGGLTPVEDERLVAARHALALVVVALGTWLALSALGAAVRIVKARHAVDVADNLEARRIHTQIGVLTQTLRVFVVVVGVAVGLMTFPHARQLGTSLLASAGIAGIVVGLSARPVLENLIAGLQIAFTQPIRIDDVVIIAGEWGRIEEITTTYVVVKIWDERRLVVPFSKFIQEPFENWTRVSADLLGTVTLRVDWTVPVDGVRAELERVVREHPDWDGRVCKLQMTEAGEETIELRALVSAGDSSRAWDLRVDVREALVGFLQREHPDALPRRRLWLREREAADAGVVANGGEATPS